MQSFVLAYKKRDDNKAQKEGDSSQIFTDQGQNPNLIQNNETSIIQEAGTNGIKESSVADVHVNIWKIHVGKLLSRVKLYFDFGIKICPDVGEVCLFIPFEIDEDGKDFDLVHLLKDSNQLLCAVFNRDLSSDISPTDAFNNVWEINDVEKKRLFSLYQLGANKFEIEKVEAGKNGESVIIGTNLKITLHDKPRDNSPIYIRFRVSPKFLNSAVKSEHISNDFLQDAFSEMDLYDFRLNELRGVHREAIDNIKAKNFDLFCFKTVHLFFIAEIRDLVENGSSIKSDCRLLENELWKDYIPHDARETSYIAHHWKKRIRKQESSFASTDLEPFNDYRIFFTSTYPKLKWIRIFVYVSVVIVLSWLGSMLTFSISKVTSLNIDVIWKPIIIGFMVLISCCYFILMSYRVIIKLIRK